jgi:soluble lytic murein transglycosylase-like protein
MPLGNAELDKLFCMYGKKYGIKKLLLKSVGIIESSLQERAYRYEPALWTNYLRDNPLWKDRDPAEVSSSYGIMQILYTTAWGLGFRGTGEELYDPTLNIGLGARLIRETLDRVVLPANSKLWPIEVCLARYNGGGYKNPDDLGVLRNQKYVNRVLFQWSDLLRKEPECSDEPANP